MVRQSTILRIILGLILCCGLIATIMPVTADETSAETPAGSVQSGATQATDTDQASPEGMEWGYTYDPSARPIRYQSYSNEVSSESEQSAAPYSNEVPVSGPAPVASFTGTPVSGTPPLTVEFTDTSTGSPTGWAWFFGDESYTQNWISQTEIPDRHNRSAHTSVVMPDGSIVLMGGWEDGHRPSLMNDILISTNAGKTWTLQKDKAPWEARFMHTSVVMPDGSIVLMGGIGFAAIYNDTWRSTDYGVHWELRNGKAPWSARARPATVVMPDGSIVLMGGYGGQDTYLNDVWRSTDYGSTWTLQNNAAEWSGRGFASSVAMPDGSIVLMGGRVRTTDLNDVWRSTNAGKTWTLQTAHAPWSARSAFSSVAMPDGSIVITGGFGEGNAVNNEVWRSTDAGKTWTQLPPSSAEWYARGFHTSHALPDGSIVIISGRTNATSFGADLNDVWRVSFAGSNRQNPSHTYASPGTYSVALQAYNAYGSNTAVRNNFINSYKPPVIEWQKTFGGSNDDDAEFITRTTDDSILVGGETASSDGDIDPATFHGLQDMVLAKFDKNSILQWKRLYGGADGETYLRQIITLDDGYLLIGSTSATVGDFAGCGHHGTTENDDIAVLRVRQSDGGPVWIRCYGGSNNDVGMWGALAADNASVVVVGYSNSNDGDFAGQNKGGNDAFAMAIDLKDGAMKNAQTYGGSQDDQATQIEQLPGTPGWFVVAGYTQSNDGGWVGGKNHGGANNTADGWIFELDRDLRFHTGKSWLYGGSDREEFWGLQVAGNGNIVTTGSTFSRASDGDIPPEKHGPAGSSDVWLLKIDSTNGSILANRCFGGSQNDYGSSVRETNEGYFLVGTTKSIDGDVTFNHGPAGTADLWLIKIDPDFRIIYQKTFGGSQDDYGKRFGYQNTQASLRGGYIAGTTESDDGDVTGNHGGGDIWILKLKAASEETLW